MTVERHPITDRDEERFWAKVEPSRDSCWIWHGAKVPDGYGSFALGYGSVKAHRFVWLLYHGEIPAGAHVLHKCDVRSCVNPGHLFLGDNDANVADRVAKGRSARNWGSKSPTCKLTPEQAAAILADKRPHKEIAAQYGISEGPVRKIKSGKGWQHVLAGVGTDIRGHLRGESCLHAKLKKSDVLEIRLSCDSGRKLAQRYGVSRSLIGSIKRREVWTDVD